jgi:hypothetical protein
MPQTLKGVDKHNPRHNSESRVTVLVAAAQRSKRGDNLSSPPHTLRVESSGSLVSQTQQPSPDVGWVAAVPRLQSIPTEKYSDFRASGAYLLHRKAAISQSVTVEAKESSVSTQKSIKEDIPLAETTLLLERRKNSGERHSKFESGSEQLLKKVLRVSTIDIGLSEGNNSIHVVERPFDDSVNISLSDITASSDVRKYELPYTEQLNEDKVGAVRGSFLHSCIFLTNCSSDVRSFAKGRNVNMQANKSWNRTNLENLLKPSQNEAIRVINRTSGNEWSPREEITSDVDVSSAMTNDIITDVNTKGVHINDPTKSSLTSGVDGQLYRVRALTNANLTDEEISKSFIDNENEMYLESDKTVSSTRELSSVAQTADLTELIQNAVPSEIEDREVGVLNVETAEKRDDFGSGTEHSISHDAAGSETNGSWVDTGGGNIYDKSKLDNLKFEVENGVISSPDTVTSISSTTPKQHSIKSENLSSPGNETTTFMGAANFNEGYEGFAGDIHALVQEDNSRDSSGIQPSVDNVKTHKRRQISLLKLFKIIANDSVLRGGHNNSNFLKHKLKNANTQSINFPYGSYFTNASANRIEQMSLGSDVLEAQIVTPIVYFGNIVHRPGQTKSSHFRDIVYEDDNEANFTHSKDTKLYQNLSSELTESVIKEVSELTSEQRLNSDNSTEYYNNIYFKNSSEDVTFNGNGVMEFITLTTRQSSDEGHKSNRDNSASRISELASGVNEYLNSSEVDYEFVSINSTPEDKAKHNVKVNALSYNGATISTPEPIDRFVDGWNTATTDISLSVSLPNYSTNDTTEPSVRRVSPVISHNDTSSSAVPGWPVKLSAEVSGDLILGGLMMVHERQDNITCGPIMPQGGIQALETMLYTLDALNKDQMIPNVTIGAHILDDCDKDTYGLEMAVDFIKGRRRWT